MVDQIDCIDSDDDKEVVDIQDFQITCSGVVQNRTGHDRNNNNIVKAHTN